MTSPAWKPAASAGLPATTFFTFITPSALLLSNSRPIQPTDFFAAILLRQVWVSAVHFSPEPAHAGAATSATTAAAAHKERSFMVSSLEWSPPGTRVAPRSVHPEAARRCQFGVKVAVFPGAPGACYACRAFGRIRVPPMDGW